MAIPTWLFRTFHGDAHNTDRPLISPTERSDATRSLDGAGITLGSAGAGKTRLPPNFVKRLQTAMKVPLAAVNLDAKGDLHECVAAGERFARR